jgi:hypothetical protein
MNGFIRLTMAGFGLTLLLSPLAGCVCYRDLVDPCWPERYNAMARQSVRDMHNAQADKGHLLDQTIWNWMFEVDPKTGVPTDRLSGAGIEQLMYISRRLPCPDGHLWIQNAQDIPYVANVGPEKLIAVRNDLNERRIRAIQRFMSTQVYAGGAANFQVAIHDFAPPGIPQRVITGTQNPPAPIQGALQKNENGFQGKLPAVQGFGSAPPPVQ